MMLRMSALISRHSQFLWVWQLVAAGASTAGFLEKVAADLDRELRTFKYPAMFPAEIAQRVDARRNSEKRGGQVHRSFPQYTELQHRPPALPGGTRWSYVSGGNDSEEGLKAEEGPPVMTFRLLPHLSEEQSLSVTARPNGTAAEQEVILAGNPQDKSCKGHCLRKAGRLNKIWGEHLKSHLATVMHGSIRSREGFTFGTTLI